MISCQEICCVGSMSLKVFCAGYNMDDTGYVGRHAWNEGIVSSWWKLGKDVFCWERLEGNSVSWRKMGKGHCLLLEKAFCCTLSFMYLFSVLFKLSTDSSKSPFLTMKAKFKWDLKCCLPTFMVYFYSKF